MRAGEFPDGAHVLRAKIDMASPNINMRDPVLYRIRHADASPHRRHVVHLPDVRLRAPLSDAHRGHHALALHARVRGPPAALRLGDRSTAEHRDTPQQIEFARLNLTYTVMSKRKLLQLVAAEARQRLGRSAHADDLAACAAAATRRRRSATSARASASRRTRTSSTSALLEHCVREDLNRRAPRVMAVLRPLKVVLTNYPGGPGRRRWTSSTTPRTPSAGTRQGAVLARALHRARRLPGGSAEEVLPPGARPRGAAALRLLHHLHRGGEGRRRRDRRAALHLRPGDARRRRARRPQGQGDAALGVGRARRRRRGAALRSPVHGRGSGSAAAKAGADFTALLNPASLEVADGLQGRADARRRRSRARASSSSGSATSPSIPTRAPGAPVFNRTVSLKDTWAKRPDGYVAARPRPTKRSSSSANSTLKLVSDP